MASSVFNAPKLNSLTLVEKNYTSNQYGTIDLDEYDDGKTLILCPVTKNNSSYAARLWSYKNDNTGKFSVTIISASNGNVVGNTTVKLRYWVATTK